MPGQELGGGLLAFGLVGTLAALPVVVVPSDEIPIRETLGLTTDRWAVLRRTPFVMPAVYVYESDGKLQVELIGQAATEFAPVIKSRSYDLDIQEACDFEKNVSVLLSPKLATCLFTSEGKNWIKENRSCEIISEFEKVEFSFKSRGRLQMGKLEATSTSSFMSLYSQRQRDEDDLLAIILLNGV